MRWGGQSQTGRSSRRLGHAGSLLGFHAAPYTKPLLAVSQTPQLRRGRLGRLIWPGELYLHSLSVKEVKAHYQAREAQTAFEVAKIQQLWQAAGQGLFLKSIQKQAALCSALEYKRQLFQAVPGVEHRHCFGPLAFGTLFVARPTVIFKRVFR